MNPILRWLCALPACIALATSALAQEGRMYTPGPFDRLNLLGIARVELTQGDKDQVFVVGNDAAQRTVRLSLSGGQLQVRAEDGWKFWNQDPLQLKIQMRQIKELGISGASDVVAPLPIKSDALDVHISGQGNVRMTELSANLLKFGISGAGSGDLAGNVAELQLRVSGKGKLQADKLKATRAGVQISGVGNADIWVTDELRVMVSGIGSVNYWGKPLLKRTVSGIAEVSAKGDK